MPNVKGQAEEEEDVVTYQGCAVVLQQKKTAQFGRANQRWYFDESTGFLQAFHTDAIDKGNHLMFIYIDHYLWFVSLHMKVHEYIYD